MLHRALTSLCVLLLFPVSCSREPAPAGDDIVLATVGKQIITVGDFRRNYEFGLPHLKRGPDRKRSYLDFMIKERVLSAQGYELGLHRSDRVRRLEQGLMEELLVEALFNREVKADIKIRPEEVREALTKSKVQWKMRYWVEPTPGFAQRVYQAMRERGYAAVVREILESNPEVTLDPKDFESGYLTWLEVTPEVLEAIRDLPLGEVSAPVEMNGMYFIFQIMDIRREPLSEYDYQNKAESFRQILFYRKLKAEAAKYVSELMTPIKVVTKGKALERITDALIEWRRQGQPAERLIEAVSEAKQTNENLWQLKRSLEDTLVAFQGGRWSIEDFLEMFDPAAIDADSNASKMQIGSALAQHIGLRVRNHHMVARAKELGLDESPEVRKQLEEWRDKWVYQETRRYFTGGLKIDDATARAYFGRYRDRYKIRWDDEPTYEEFAAQARRDAYIQRARALLAAKVDSLAGAGFTITVNQSVLDTITTIDFEKSRWMSMQVFKRSTHRMAVPIVDPAWGF